MCRMKKEKLSIEKRVKIVLSHLRVDKEVFQQAEDSYFAINPTDIIELLTNKKLELGILTCFEMSLHKLKGRSQQNKVGFLHHEMITPDVYGADKGVTLDYLARALEGYEFYVAPYLQGAHYVLFIFWILRRNQCFIPRTTTGLLDLWIHNVLGGSLKWELPTIPWGEERRLENKELDAVIGAWTERMSTEQVQGCLLLLCIDNEFKGSVGGGSPHLMSPQLFVLNTNIFDVALRMNHFNSNSDGLSSGSWLLSGRLAKLLLIDSEHNDSTCPLAVSADARTLVQQARNEAAEFRFKYGYKMPVEVMAKTFMFQVIYESVRLGNLVPVIITEDEYKEGVAIEIVEAVGALKG
ncbi:ulp1 protease family, C-terminal catalytic domain-containing protein [Tanacetum coccineum]